jgi:TPR repeat protein
LELAERGYDVAMIEVGRRMVKGEAGTDRRIADGVGWLERASKKGSKLAAYVLGELYWTGAVSGAQDRATAVIHFEKATDGGVSGPVNTRMLVASWHSSQENPQRQVSRAIEILGPIARFGDNQAQALLGELLIEEGKTLEGLAMLVASYRRTGDEAVLKILRARLAGRPDEDLARVDELAESIQRETVQQLVDKYLPAK